AAAAPSLDRGGGDTATRRIPAAACTAPSPFADMEAVMTTATLALAKDALKQDFPGCNIICSAQGGWWGQLFPVPYDRYTQTNMFDARTAAGLRAKLTAATS
ncbi:MAG: hypothetical protein ACRDNL_00390, partial [Spirillospora sp.]